MEGEAIKRLGFGCVGLTIQPTVKQALRLLDCAYDLGIRLYDTAPLYGAGYSELVLGKFIKDKRDNVTITTKFGLGSIPQPKIPEGVAIPLNFLRKQLFKHFTKKTPPHHFNFQRTSYRCIEISEVKQYLDGSLKRLNTPYIDNYLIHEGIPSFLTAQALDFLMQKKEQGVIRRLGIGASFKNIETLHEEELKEWDVLQYEYGLKIPSAALNKRFTTKKHICHSIFKSLAYVEFPNIPPQQKAGYLLAHHLKENSRHTLLFSSSKVENIQNNIRYAAKFYPNID